MKNDSLWIKHYKLYLITGYIVCYYVFAFFNKLFLPPKPNLRLFISQNSLSVTYSMVADLSEAGEEWYCWMVICHQMWLNLIKFEANFLHCIYSLSREGMVKNCFKVGTEDPDRMKSKGIRNHHKWVKISAYKLKHRYDL